MKFESKEQASQALSNLNNETYYDHMVKAKEPLMGVWSKSALWGLANNPVKFQQDIPKEETSEMRYGKLVDIYTTDPEKWRTGVHVMSTESFQSKAAKEEKDRATKEGKIVCRPSELEKIKETYDALEAYCDREEAPWLMGNFQVVLDAVVKMDGPQGAAYVPVKGLPDIMVGNELRDLKVTNDVTEAGLLRNAKMFGYHWQEAMYTRLCEVNGIIVDSFGFIEVEKDQPHRVIEVSFTDQIIEAAMRQIDKAFRAVYELAHGRSADSFHPRSYEFGFDSKPVFSTWDILKSMDVNPEITVEWMSR